MYQKVYISIRDRFPIGDVFFWKICPQSEMCPFVEGEFMIKIEEIKEELKNILLSIAHNPQTLLGMKINCTAKAQNYLPSGAIKILLQNMVIYLILFLVKYREMIIDMK